MGDRSTCTREGVCIPDMSREVKIESHFLEPPYKIVEHIASYGDEQGRIRPVNADVTQLALRKRYYSLNHL